ncbi:hypothetical protein C7Y66_06750 [Chroococcidiopsis sp. CCALA 051]|nr:hypothetical protein C7Y66_06750 [Chroococcidiopsis sp. CCALA 051]
MSRADETEDRVEIIVPSADAFTLLGTVNRSLGLSLSILNCMELKFMPRIVFWNELLQTIYKNMLSKDKCRQIATPSS